MIVTWFIGAGPAASHLLMLSKGCDEILAQRIILGIDFKLFYHVMPSVELRVHVSFYLEPFYSHQNFKSINSTEGISLHREFFALKIFHVSLLL